MTADNSFEAWINGRSAATGFDFTQTFVADVKPLLKPGENILAVAAENGAETPNPAGLIGSLTIQFREGPPLQLHTDGKWETATTAAQGVEVQ